MNQDIILCGGVERSGLNLLSLMLDSHSEVLCGPPTNLLCHQNIWQETGGLTSLAHVLAQRNLPSTCLPWAIPAAADLKYYFTTEAELREVCSLDENITHFAAFVHKPRKVIHNKKIAIDASHDNIFGAPSMMANGVLDKFLFLTRDPLDSISAQQKTRVRSFFCTARWVLKNAVALALLEKYGSNKVHIIKYEDLVQNTEKTLSKICTFLAIPDEPHRMTARKDHERSTTEACLNGHADTRLWQHSVFDEVSTEGIGNWNLSHRFAHLLTVMRANLDPSTYPDIETDTRTGLQITKALGYTFPEKLIRIPQIPDNDKQPDPYKPLENFYAANTVVGNSCVVATTPPHKGLTLCGGVEGSGLNLLSLMLDSHSQILCGPTTNLFCHPEANNNKTGLAFLAKLLGQPEQAKPYLAWAEPNIADLKYYSAAAAQLEDVCRTAQNMRYFAAALHMPRMVIYDKTFPVDASHDNIFAAPLMFSQGILSKFIFLTREPLASITTQNKARVRPYFSTARWVLKNSLARSLLQKYGPEKVCIIKYEDLIENPIAILGKICSFLNLPPEQNRMLARETHHRNPQERGLLLHSKKSKWSHSIFAELSTTNLSHTKLSNRFAHLLTALTAKLNGPYFDGLSTNNMTGLQLAEAMNYAFPSAMIRQPNIVETESIPTAGNALENFYAANTYIKPTQKS